jgi:hypothetical protein
VAKPGKRKYPLKRAVDLESFAATNRIDGMGSFVEDRFDPSYIDVHQDPLFDKTDSRKREMITIYRLRRG